MPTDSRFDDLGEGFLESLKSFFNDQIMVKGNKGIFAVQEVSKKEGKLHYHVYTTVVETTCRKKYKESKLYVKNTFMMKYLGKTKENPYTSEDHDRLMRYYCKGAGPGQLPVVILNDLYTDEQIKDFHERYYSWTDASGAQDPTKGSFKKVSASAPQEDPLSYKYSKSNHFARAILAWFDTCKDHYISMYNNDVLTVPVRHDYVEDENSIGMPRMRRVLRRDAYINFRRELCKGLIARFAFHDKPFGNKIIREYANMCLARILPASAILDNYLAGIDDIYE